MAILHDVGKQRFVFLITLLLLIFVNKEISFREYIEMELKIFFITSEAFFKLEK